MKISIVPAPQPVIPPPLYHITGLTEEEFDTLAALCGGSSIEFHSNILSRIALTRPFEKRGVVMLCNTVPRLQRKQ